MKTALRAVSGIQWVCASLLTIGVAAGSFSLQQLSAPHRPAPHGLNSAAEEEEEEEEEKRRDRPDLALAQDAAFTRDPATGTVPRERLLVAHEQIEQMLDERASRRAIGGSLSAANWTEKGPSNIGGRVRSILIDPADASGNTVWAASVGGGLWKSTNAMATTPTWTRVNDLFGNLAITTLAVDPGNSDIMYFGTGEGFGNADAIRGLGIWKSTDHGVTWAQLASTSNSSFYYVNKIVVDGAGRIYAANTNGGLRRSTDGGATWTAVLFTTTSVGDVDINPSTGAVYAASGPGTTGQGIFRSPSGDAGTFTNLNTLPGNGLPPSGTTTRVEVALAPSAPDQMYAMFCSGGGGTPAITRNTLYGIYRSADGGNTWQALPKPNDADTGIPDADFTRTQAWYDLEIAVSPTDPGTVFVGGVDIFKTSNGTTATAANVTWRQVTHWYGGFGFQNIHADQHAITFLPGSGAIAFFGNDGGVARTANASAITPTLTHINSGLNVTQFYSVAAHPTDYSYFLAGAQDNGTQQFRSTSGTTTRDINGGDGAFCFIDEDQPQYQFATYVFSNIYRTSTGGAETQFPETVFESNTGSFINPMEYDSKANVLYFSYGSTTLGRIIRATGPIGNATTGPAQSTITLPSGSGTVTHVAVSPNVDNRVYVGTNTGRVIRIDNANGTATATTIYNYGSSVSISGVAVERSAVTPDPDQHILVTIANYGATSVQQTTNGGTSWASAEGNLPDMPVRWVIFDPTGGKRAMVATELGVWSTDDLTAASVVWQVSNTNLANVRVDMLRVRKADRMVVAATHGRGVFTSNVFIVNPLPVELTSFTGQPTEAGVALRWQTASEHGSRSFEVERAAEGQAFQVVGSKPAAGTSSTARTYNFLDETVGTGKYAYRLHQLDQDGSASYSPVVTVTMTASATPLLTSAFPNPFSDQLTLQLREPVRGDIVTTLTNVQGSVVYRARQQSVGRQVPLAMPATLAAGSYLLTVQAEGQKATRRVVRR
ncbi:T9SS type A sorting domain-containing protein [Hymenobacter aquaticus]|uniref:T9SS type A sorting domain-containing protein n=1 Tax=Hymenobacter aquaticus TaxID=1867101 RepID=A0A4Z0PTJ5_9BACT|nr:T9SS type A sorting domain-containing protein [Hymenobacter aquaticus]TGE20584.1 T9SS type A sorting domain-containing protein [Hymenobacter aquaticus]